MASLVPIPCPICGKTLVREQVRAGVLFKCPHCSSSLRLSQYYVLMQFLIGGIIAGLAGYFCGARGGRLFLATILLWVPAYAVSYAISNKYFPPWIVPCDPNDSGLTS
jgi:hypothetical protein